MSRLEDLAIYSDRRFTASDERWWSAIDGRRACLDHDVFGPLPATREDQATWIDVRFEICPVCDGTGKHVNPSVDAHGLTASDFDEDPDMYDSYFRGDYDVTCNLCRGEKVVPVPTDPIVQDQLDEELQDRAQSRAEQLEEMRWGA
jgi:hypothetical protein